MKNGDNWQCPFCLHRQVLSEDNYHHSGSSVGSTLNKHSIRRCRVASIECMNSECREICLWTDFGDYVRSGGVVHYDRMGPPVLSFRLRPLSIAKPQHAAVPSTLVTDYEEACAITAASPKAAATLARRCLQGMIRDFCGISRKTLYGEIVELKRQVEDGTAPRQVSEESIVAIDSVRELGNIGAHFQADINQIIDVDAEETTALIGLIELLFQEWYVSRYERQQRLSTVQRISAEKKTRVAEKG
jgi:hypothetical protein